MLQIGLSHGVAVIPNPPKQCYTCERTGAHFRFDDLCARIERLKNCRKLAWKKETEEVPTTQNGVSTLHRDDFTDENNYTIVA